MSTDHEGTSALALEPRRRRVWARLAILPLAVAVSVALVSASSAGTHAAAAPRCDVNDEHFTYFPAAEGAAGSVFEKFRIRHRGKRPRCTLRGYAKIQWLGRKGKILPIKTHRDHSFKVRTRVLRKDHPVWFVVRHPAMDPKTGRQCPARVRKVRVLLPHHSKPLVVKGFDPVRFCDKGARKTPFLRKAG
jgi:Protein of unknown function (DUF4232)